MPIRDKNVGGPKDHYLEDQSKLSYSFLDIIRTEFGEVIQTYTKH